MANDQGKSYGASPIMNPQSPPVVLPYRVETSATLQYFRGQFVAINSNGRVEPVAATASGGVVSIGVVWNFLDLNLAGVPSGMTSLTQGGFLPASTDAFAEVIVDPHQLYLMEEITGGTAISTNSIGLGVDFTYIATTGNTTTGFATSVLRNVGLTVGSQNLLQLMNVYNIMNNDGTFNAPGASCKWVVRIQRHQFSNVTLPNPQLLV